MMMNSSKCSLNSSGKFKKYNMRRSYTSKLRSSQCNISGIENVSTYLRKRKNRPHCNVKKHCPPREKYVSSKSLSHIRDYTKENILSKEPSTDEDNLRSPKENDNDDYGLLESATDMHRKTYSTRKHLRSCNTDLIDSNSQRNNYCKSNSFVHYEPSNKIYNAVKSLNEEVSTNVNNSISTEEVIKSDGGKSRILASLSQEPDRKIYNIRKRSSDVTLGNATGSNYKSSELDLYMNDDGISDSLPFSNSVSPLKTYNTRQHSSSSNTSMNNSESPECILNINDSDEDSDSSSYSNSEPPHKAYNTRKQKSNNLSTNSFDVVNVGDMRHVKAVRWDHPDFKSNNGNCTDKKYGMIVKNITIENICKFNNIHYSKPDIYNTQFSRIYVDELNMLLSIYPVQNTDNSSSVYTTISKRKRKCTRMTKCKENEPRHILKHSNEGTEENTFTGELDTQLLHNIRNDFPKVFVRRICEPQATQPDNILFLNTMYRLNKSSYRKKFAGHDGHCNDELIDYLHKAKDVSGLDIDIENMERKRTANGLLNNKIDNVSDKSYPLRNRHG